MALSSRVGVCVGLQQQRRKRQKENPVLFVCLFICPTLGDEWAQKGLGSLFDGLSCLPPPLEVGLGQLWMDLWPNPVRCRSLLVSTLERRMGLALDGSCDRSGLAPNVPPTVPCGWWEVVPLSFPQGPTVLHCSLMPRTLEGFARRGQGS